MTPSPAGTDTDTDTGTGAGSRSSSRSRSLHGLVAALLADDGREPWPAATADRLDALLTALPAPARAGLRTAAAAVDAYALLRT
ncbi:hypothetical protein, partial [Kitasatospora sp. MBT63]